MNKKRALLVVMCCALVGAFFIPGFIASAASVAVTFDDGGDAYTIEEGTIGSVGGAHANVLVRSAGPHSARIRIDLPSASTVTHVSLQSYKNAGPPFNMGRGIWLYNASNTRVGYTFGDPASYYISYENWSAYEWVTASWDGSVADVSYIIAFITSDGTFTSYLDNIGITYSSDSPTVTPSASPTPTATFAPVTSWNKPLRLSDQKPDDLAFHPAQTLGGVGFNPSAFNDVYSLNMGFSAMAGANAFAIFPGTIASVLPFSCAPAIGPDGFCEIRWLDMPVSRYGIQVQDAYVITESLADGRSIAYLVTTPLVAAGATVTGGCLIGTVPHLYDYFGNALGEGALLIQGIESTGSATFDLSPLLITEPSGIACAVATDSTCALVDNASFLSTGGAWQIEPGSAQSYIPYLVPDGGVFFPLSIGQVLNLDAAASYRIQLIYEVQANSPTQHITVSLGNTDTEIYLRPTVDKTTYTIPADTYTPDLSAGLYSFRIKGEADADRTTLYFACVQDSTDSIPVPGDGCIVLDGNFNQSYTDSPWSVSGAPDPPAVIPGGMAVIPDGGFISQSITLYPGAAGANVNYDLLVTYRRQGIASAGKDVLLSWEFGSASGDLTPASESQLWADYTATFGVATNVVTDDLILTATGSDSVQAAQVKSICIHTHDGGTPPGYRDPLPFTGGCRFCVYSPVGDLTTDFSEFQQWLACQFFQLWECQAKILLRYIWTILANILTLFGFFRLWLSAVLINLVTWGNGNLAVFAQWLYGQINNAAQEIVYAILTLSGGGGGGGTNLWDFLIALINGIFGLLQVFVQLVANIMQLIISGVIGFLVNGVGLLLGLLQSVINGLNTAPAAIDAAWLPNCTDATSGLFVVCSAIYGVEAGLAIGPFQYLVPIGVGLGALNLLWWGIAKIKGVFSE